MLSGAVIAAFLADPAFLNFKIAGLGLPWLISGHFEGL
jgi:hypothetical protein